MNTAVFKTGHDNVHSLQWASVGNKCYFNRMTGLVFVYSKNEYR